MRAEHALKRSGRPFLIVDDQDKGRSPILTRLFRRAHRDRFIKGAISRVRAFRVGLGVTQLLCVSDELHRIPSKTSKKHRLGFLNGHVNLALKWVCCIIWWATQVWLVAALQQAAQGNTANSHSPRHGLAAQ
jgi:hypothetical protein